jgi:hypothetical protein
LQGEALRDVYGLPAPGKRVADLGDSGFIEFVVDDDAGLVSVYNLMYTG